MSTVPGSSFSAIPISFFDPAHLRAKQPRRITRSCKRRLLVRIIPPTFTWPTLELSQTFPGSSLVHKVPTGTSLLQRQADVHHQRELNLQLYTRQIPGPPMRQRCRRAAISAPLSCQAMTVEVALQSPPPPQASNPDRILPRIQISPRLADSPMLQVLVLMVNIMTQPHPLQCPQESRVR